MMATEAASVAVPTPVAVNAVATVPPVLTPTVPAEGFVRPSPVFVAKLAPLDDASAAAVKFGKVA
jgi:hypothetical protein